MIYIKLDDSMNLVITVNEPIYRGDNLNQKIIYLIPLQVGEIDMLLRPQTTFRCWLSMRFSAHAPMRTLPKRTIRRSMPITLLEIRR